MLAQETLDHLIERGAAIWDEFRQRTSDRHHLFIPCDHAEAHEALARLRPRASTFLELGSAAGVVTIIADLLGYESFGIEIEPWLVDRSTELAEEVGSGATFAEGSFVPPEHQDEVALLSSDFHTPTTGAPAYDELGFELADFDLIYAYPWPGEEDWLLDLLRRYARPDAILLTYDAAEGFRISEDFRALE